MVAQGGAHPAEPWQDQKRQDAAVALQAKLLADPIKPSANTSPLADESPTQTSFPLFSGAGAAHPHGHGPPISAPPAAPSANPALLGAEPAHYAPTPAADDKKGRKRSGSGTAQFAQTQAQAKEVFNDFASQGKKQINSFLSRLGGDRDRDRSGAGTPAGERDDAGAGAAPPAVSAPVVSGFSHTHSRSLADRPAVGTLTTRDAYLPPGAGASGLGKPPSALKGVKLRREMEEADKAYREAVFNLETLRLRREKIQTAANEVGARGNIWAGRALTDSRRPATAEPRAIRDRPRTNAQDDADWLCRLSFGDVCHQRPVDRACPGCDRGYQR